VRTPLLRLLREHQKAEKYSRPSPEFGETERLNFSEAEMLSQDYRPQTSLISDNDMSFLYMHAFTAICIITKTGCQLKKKNKTKKLEIPLTELIGWTTPATCI
jgi:hypothetical protein